MIVQCSEKPVCRQACGREELPCGQPVTAVWRAEMPVGAWESAAAGRAPGDWHQDALSPVPRPVSPGRLHEVSSGQGPNGTQNSQNSQDALISPLSSCIPFIWNALSHHLHLPNPTHSSRLRQPTFLCKTSITPYHPRTSSLPLETCADLSSLTCISSRYNVLCWIVSPP